MRRLFEGTAFGDALVSMAARAEASRPLRLYAQVDLCAIKRPAAVLAPWMPWGYCRVLSTHATNPRRVELATDLLDADFAVLPFDASVLVNGLKPGAAGALDAAESFLDQARSAGVPTMILCSSDVAGPLPVTADLILRHSIDHRRPHRGTYCLPGWFAAQQDPEPLQVQPSPHGDKPVVGFCGQSRIRKAAFWRLLRSARDTFEIVQRRFGPHGVGSDHVNAPAMRERALDIFARARSCTSNFVVRTGYYTTLADGKSAADEYRANMLGSDYVLCVRGLGNYSFRFYDALSMGRVPAVMDTDAALPFDHVLDYSEILPVIPFARWSDGPEIVAEHYARFSGEQWSRLLQDLRTFFVEWLLPNSFFSRLALFPEVETRLEQRKADNGDRAGADAQVRNRPHPTETTRSD